MGAFELINRLEGHFDQDDLEALEHLAGHAAVALANTREHQRLSRSRDQLTEQVARGARLIGNSPAIIALRDTIERLANTDLPVLVLGASGTGKEVVSRALHVGGSRADQPFVAVNCAAISETLLESELFGHEKGAFTDAAETRKGKFELADEGTLFLDEIGDMSPGGQAKLLRVLEQKVITRVGGSQTIPINVRVIAATNQDLSEAVGEKRFREDLFYRLSVVTLELPPLSDRPEDILPLAEHFLCDFCVEAGRSPLTLAPEAQQRLTGHTWPGNVRELRNLMERVAFLCPGDQIEIDDLAFILAPGREPDVEMPADAGLAEATRRFQVDYIRRSIRLAANNMTEAARLLGLHRSNLYRKMGQLEMTESEQEPPAE
ncbi:MAG TPA: sigma-54-dependent Fis family transcriptional regulator, partial [Planctomycetaceae bacterium]|nr:sigma-54-dependent Fis family transcriptional regulator [Planctomycetaceae bacterium]